MCTEAIKEYFITDNTDFYGLWEKNEKTYTVMLKVHGAVVRRLVGEFRTVVDLPKDIPSELHKDNCTLLGWANKHEWFVHYNFTIPAKDVELHASLVCKHIRSVNEFFEFSRIVNSIPITTEMDTVYLEEDLDFTDFGTWLLQLGTMMHTTTTTFSKEFLIVRATPSAT